MIKAAVFSDSHGSVELMCQAVSRTRPDLIIHLGDYERDCRALLERFPAVPLYSVCGNCDLAALSPARDTVQIGPVRAFITHGHLYNVKYYLDPLVYAAQEQGASLALFGHTHEPENCEMGGVRLINPGSAGTGRRPSWALIEVNDMGGIACDIREL